MSLIKRLNYIFIAITLSMSAVYPVKAQTQDCIEVARIFGEVVCRAEITVEEKQIEAIKKQFEEEGLDSEAALKSKAMGNLKDIIWQRALEHKFGKGVLSPAEEEISIYSAAFKDSLDISYEENKKTAAKIKILLAGDKHNLDDKRKLRSLLRSIETSVTFYEARKGYNKDMPAEYHAMVNKAQHDIARTMVRDWKINKLLYHEYGGRIAFWKSGLEPVDAYGNFLGYIRKEGGLVISDKGYSDIFKVMELYIAVPQNIIPKSDTGIYENYFSTPQWQFEMGQFEMENAAQNKEK